ncbi:MAG: DUF99 family protein [Candidatus Micrarchaeota archaeon]
MKQGIRVLGIDDSPFLRSDKTTLIVGVVCRKESEFSKSQGLIVEGVLSTHVLVDGDNGTAKLCEMILRSRFRQELCAIMLNGIMLAGFNAVDIVALSEKTNLPVLALTRKKPDQMAVFRAIKNTKNWEEKLLRIQAAGPSKCIEGWHAQLTEIDLNDARDIIRVFGNGPQRLAHIIASGIVDGESHGRA